MGVWGFCGGSMEIMWRLGRPLRRNAALDIANAQCPAMQLHHFLYKIEPKPCALTSTVRTRQRIEALTQSRQRVFGNRFGLIEQFELNLFANPLRAESQHAIHRREIQRILQQITQRLTQQKRLTSQRQIPWNRLIHA